MLKKFLQGLLNPNEISIGSVMNADGTPFGEKADPGPTGQKTTITVNSKTVYSDKSVKDIIGTKITFKDGSWCDTATGKIVNNGPGYISLDSPEDPAGSERITRGPEPYATSVLGISNLDADVDVTVSPDEHMHVTTIGLKSEIDAIDIQAVGPILSIAGKGNSLKAGQTNISISGNRSSYKSVLSNMSIRGSTNITISSGDCVPKLTVAVPKGTAVRIQGIHGDTTIGDTEGPLQAKLSGSDDISVGKVTDANLSTTGSGDIEINSVTGTLSLTVTGSGDISVAGGTVTMLNAKTTGSGDITFDGKADDASLISTGSGDITVRYVKNKPTTRSTGSGDIEVKNR
jgi:hypothetical protein